ncbi:WD40 repeat domain-containing protein [Phanerochaete sordida]|uniref:WD40 repeat domain-containing protein n=1 Tax=Phanerochaete sordida TaxID=48140 RepID=A0A9P3GG46_9APHY|nr:WD40 repeat domain-containing protein [Phanerochaete sordida]
MFWSNHIPSAPHDIYSSSFAPIQHGYALWVPEPQKHGEPQIGDVGFFVSGGFHRLFSLDTLDPLRKVTKRPIPFEATEPLPPELLETHTTSRRLVAKAHCSYGVKASETSGQVDVGVGSGSAGVGAKYACIAAQGAVLELQSAADSEVLYRNTLLKAYILRNHAHWVAYARETLHLDVKEEEIVFISGTVKSRADWAVMAFSNTLRSYQGSVSGRVSGVAGLAAGHSHTSLAIGAEMERYGEHYAQSGDRSRPVESDWQDQSILLERYMVRRWLRVLKNMSAGAGYYRPPSDRGGQDESREGQSASSKYPYTQENQNGDSVESLLEYMFETAGVGVAIASDSDITGIMGSRTAIDFGSYLRKAQPPVHVDGAVGWISMEDVIASERKRLIARRHITASVLKDWPNASQDGAGYLKDVQVTFGPGYAKRDPVTIPTLAFADSAQLSRGAGCIAVSRDGEYLAASFGSNSISVWRTKDGLRIQHIQDQGRSVLSLAFSPDNRRLASATEGKRPAVWDVRTGRRLFYLEGHTRGGITHVVYAPTGPFIATVSKEEQAVRVWDAGSGACLNPYRTREAIDRLSFSPTSDQLYIQLKTQCVTYDLAIQDVTAKYSGSRNKEPSFALSSDGDFLAVLSAPDIVQVYRLRNGREHLRITHSKGLSGPLAFSPNSTELLACCPEEQSAVAFDMEKGLPCYVYRACAEVRNVSYSQNGEYIVTGSGGGLVEIFDARSTLRIAAFDSGNVMELVSQPEHGYVFVRPLEGPIYMHNVCDLSRLM